MRIFLAAILALAASAATADLVIASKGNELRLLNEPCEHEAVLSQIKDEYRPQFKRAAAKVGARSFAACWIDTMQGAYYVVFETGDEMAYPVSAFVSEPGV